MLCTNITAIKENVIHKHIFDTQITSIREEAPRKYNITRIYMLIQPTSYKLFTFEWKFFNENTMWYIFLYI